ncbi:hypothetical protein Q6346_15250, partial [Isoptericola sp. b490]|uniref:hypothetical protein n=1 Tax=Actinotalea lenta TaxID=3064654 RepID=UPI0027133625
DRNGGGRPRTAHGMIEELTRTVSSNSTTQRDVTAYAADVSIDSTSSAAQDRHNEFSHVVELIRWLEMSPPYEAIGQVVVAAAELELHLIGLALDLGLPAEKAWFRDKRAKYLKSSKALPGDILERIGRSFERRDLIVHGVWINRFGRGEAFARLDRAALGKKLRGSRVSRDDLDDLRAELAKLADLVEARRPRMDSAE